ncbi:hypothetical protein PoB_006774000 [Plakobranchus ocellatus]|uniref:Uncharacterized protein n=1 Tax=Plakobranchus ocellatus TaxID=259542 RepID=A0AAV4DBA4_9GAST|nr:hypothetical protein PoB_006774000 [Plakobranchus ocellatus]
MFKEKLPLPQKREVFALVSAAADFNNGPKSLAMVKRSLGFQEGEHDLRLGQARLSKRLHKSNQEKQKAKKPKKVTAAAQEKTRQEKEAEEGGPAYQPGMF